MELDLGREKKGKASFRRPIYVTTSFPPSLHIQFDKFLMNLQLDRFHSWENQPKVSLHDTATI